jgi:phage tail protein X
MSVTKYLTREGDILDDLCFRIYGKQDAGQVEAVLLANPNLSEVALELPAQTVITFPDLTTEAKATVRLW